MSLNLDKENIALISISAILVITTFYLILSLKKPLTTELYIKNTYLYILISILLCSSMLLIFEKKDTQVSSSKLLPLFIINILLLFGIFANINNLVTHILWILFILSTSYTLVPIFNLTKNNNSLGNTLITLIILVACLIFYSSTVGINKFDSWGSYLGFALLGLIIFECIDLIFSNDSKNLNSRFKIYSIIAIVLFSAFLLYDSKKIEQHGNEILLNKNKLNYPGETLNIYLDIINLFSSISSVNN